MPGGLSAERKTASITFALHRNLRHYGMVQTDRNTRLLQQLLVLIFTREALAECLDSRHFMMWRLES
jgi:hypothetical protein